MLFYTLPTELSIRGWIVGWVAFNHRTPNNCVRNVCPPEIGTYNRNRNIQTSMFQCLMPFVAIFSRISSVWESLPSFVQTSSITTASREDSLLIYHKIQKYVPVHLIQTSGELIFNQTGFPNKTVRTVTKSPWHICNEKIHKNLVVPIEAFCGISRQLLRNTQIPRFPRPDDDQRFPGLRNTLRSKALEQTGFSELE